MNITTAKAPRSQRHILLSSIPSECLEFDLEIVSTNGTMNARKMQYIKSWLCGQLQFRPLVIQHEDFENTYFNCVMNKPEDIYVNGYQGLHVTVSCDAGGAWSNPITSRYSMQGGGIIVIANESGDNDYLYPSVQFTLESSATSFLIENITEGNRQFLFTELAGGETISINGNTGHITSSLHINRLPNFNKKFLRLLPGANALRCSGGAEKLIIAYQNFIRLGG